jgi:PAS domain S-box-containing protein
VNAPQRPPQRPLELILARNFLSSVSTAAFLVDGEGQIAFYNEAAGDLLGRRFEEVGPQPAQDWGTRHGPFAQDGDPIPFGELDLTRGLRRGRPGHSNFHIRTEDGKDRLIEASAMPIQATSGQRGAMVFFWPVDEEVPE